MSHRLLLGQDTPLQDLMELAPARLKLCALGSTSPGNPGAEERD
jgi:hypothetical protein